MSFAQVNTRKWIGAETARAGVACARIWIRTGETAGNPRGHKGLPDPKHSSGPPWGADLLRIGGESVGNARAQGHQNIRGDSDSSRPHAPGTETLR